MKNMFRMSIVLAVLVILFTGCPNDNIPTNLDQVAAPTASPGAGAIIADRNIALRTTTAGATIRYTTNGTTPTANTGTVYSGRSFKLTSLPATIKAIAYKAGMTDSAVLTVAYTPADQVAPPTASPMESLDGGSITTTTGSEVFIAGRPITLSPFKIARYETTYQLWKEVYDWAVKNGYIFANPGVEGHDRDGTGTVGTASEKATRPVTSINWRDAIVWCNAYSEMSGKTPVYYTDAAYTIVLRESTNTETATAADTAKMNLGANGYRLPTEAEWEYAARGGDQSDTINWGYTYAGSNTVGDVAWYQDNSASFYPGIIEANQGAHRVGTKAANSKGLYDMSGNVYEWCWDWYDTISASTLEGGAASGTSRVARGGSWINVESLCTVAFRNRSPPNARSGYGGFRVVCP